MSVYSNWTHAHSAVLQDKGWNITNIGSLATVTPSISDTQDAVHFSIPTPTEVAGASVAVTSVTVRISCGPQAQIVGIYIYDGETTLVKYTGLSEGSPTIQNYTWTVPNSTLSYGLA